MSDQHALYIDGEWINTEASVANISPSDSHDVIGHYAQASIEHVDQAIEAANRAVADWGVGPRRHSRCRAGCRTCVRPCRSRIS